MTPLVGPALSALVLSILLTAAMRQMAPRLGLVATPKADRWHRGSIPLLGGVAIAASVTIVAAASGLGRDTWVLLAGAGSLSLLGVVDDVRPLRPQTRLVLQLLVAAAVSASGLTLHLTSVAAVDQLMTVFWLVALTNAFNLLDNMDGLSAGIALIACVLRLLFFLQDGYLEGATLAAILSAALVGFLAFNFQPASIFMGDAGSLFLGFAVGGLSVIGPWAYSRGTFSVVLLPVLLLIVPLFDTAFVTIMRTLAGRSVAQGGRDHTSHRLVALGLSERHAVLALWAVAAASGGVALLSYRYGLSATATLIGLVMVSVLVLGAQLARLRVYPEGAAPGGMVALVADLRVVRPVATVSLDALLIVLAYYGAYQLRFEGQLGAELSVFTRSLLTVFTSQLLALAAFRTYKDRWEYAGLRDMIRLIQASTAGVIASVLVLVGSERFAGYSRAVFAIDWLLLSGLLCASRLAFRALGELAWAPPAEGPRTLIYGAGAGGMMVLREAKTNRALGWHVVGFVDDDRDKQRTNLQGVPVLGGIDRLLDLVRDGGIDQIVISTGSLEATRAAAVRALCRERGVSVVQASLRLDVEST